jgi:hypothetical protein
MVPEAKRLHAALVAAFPAYATRRFADAGYPLDKRSVEAIEAATTRLDFELADELERPFVDQRRTPLELFDNAIGTLTPILLAAGVEPRAGGRSSDPYDLAPGSTAVLGEAVQRAQAAWGAAKASAFTGGDPRGPQRPTVVVMTMDRVARQQLCYAAEQAGYQCVPARNPSGVAGAIAADKVKLGLVDLAHRAARDAVERLRSAGVTTIVFGAAIDDLTETGLLAAGVRTVVDREALLTAPEEHLPRLV